MKSSIKDDGEQVPPDFGNTNETLLVIRKGKRSYDKYLEENFEKNYFGKYIIIDKSELESSKYKSIEVYRYVFDEEFNQEYISANSAQRSANRGRQFKDNGQSVDYGLHTYARFQVQDRRTGTVYKTKHGTGAFSKWMKAYIQALEKSRRQKTKQ
ncbi:hypothetical protein [Terrimonas alba]|uniref:hypothetical protein n=1 Tax=Terrimonas alba TaxID=3349636 RepID=UPI0035F3536E